MALINRHLQACRDTGFPIKDVGNEGIIEGCRLQEARAALVKRLRHAKAIDLHEVERGKYFRLVAEVIADGENLSALLLKWDLARPYDDRTRGRTFCAGTGGYLLRMP